MHKEYTKLRIALVTYSLRMGGVETFLQNIATHFRSNGQDVYFVETEERGEWSDQTRQLGFPVITVARRGWLTRRMHCKKVASCLKAFDVLLINDSPLAMAILGLLPPSTVSVPVLHNAIPSMIANATANSAEWQWLVTVSPGLLDELLKSKLVEARKATCIPNGVPLHPVRSRSSIPTDPLRVIYVGRLEQKQKNIFAIPKIIERANRDGAPVLVEIVGDGPDSTTLRELLESSSINWTMSGHLSREDTIQRLKASDVLLMPSQYEGLPMTLLEAMSCSVVPVASRLAGSTDVVVEHGVSGFLADYIDESEFVEPLIKLANDRILLTTMAQNARETISSRFSIEAMSSTYLALIRDGKDELRLLPPKRSGRIAVALLGDFSRIPYGIVRPLRKFLRLTRLYPFSAPIFNDNIP